MNTRRIGSAPSYDCEEENDSVECEDVKKNYSDIDYAIRYTQKKGKTELGFLQHRSMMSHFLLEEIFMP